MNNTQNAPNGVGNFVIEDNERQKAFGGLNSELDSASTHFSKNLPLNTSNGKTNRNPQLTSRNIAEDLISLGYSALPVAPAQDPDQYKNKEGKPLFTGKNPSYLDENGKPHLIKHKNYQDRLPTKDEIKLWWTNPLNGVGCLGGGLDETLVWIDLDSKNFKNPSECDRAFVELITANPVLQNAPIQKTQSGGYRIGVKLEKPLGFTNFALKEGGNHVGECLGKGRFAVLAPTVGPNGNPYEILNDSQDFPLVDCSQFLFPYSAKKSNANKSQQTTKHRQQAISDHPPQKARREGVVDLLDCLSSKATSIYISGDIKDDRSDSLTTFAKECFGWSNWLNQNNVAFTGDPYELVTRVGVEMKIDGDRIERILKTIDISGCSPACQSAGGDDACWAKVEKLLGQKVRKFQRIANTVDRNLSLSERLLELLSKQGTEAEILRAAIELTRDLEDPLGDLRQWTENELSQVDVSKLDLAIRILGALNSEYGNLTTGAWFVRNIKEKHDFLTNLNDIKPTFNQGAKLANPPLTEKQLAMEEIRNAFPNTRFNLLTGKVELNGEEFKKVELAYLHPKLIDKELKKELTSDALVVHALAHEYHPVKDYLESLSLKPNLPPELWDNLAFHLLGTDDPLAQIVLKKALIAAVARIYQPGCYVRMIPVLQGDQTTGKSSFIRLLAGDDFYSGSLGKLDNPKDDYQLLHSYWVHEWEEIDKLNKKSAADIKAFITKTKDDYRAPYARAPESHTRQCVIWGSCNRQDFLKDSTGNTRFSVIECREINLDLVKQWRDLIWATAKAKYQEGEQWELTKFEQQLSEVNNQAYMELDAWYEDIEAFVEDKELISVNECLNYLQVDISKKDSLNSKRIRDILTQLGWVRDKNPTTYQGARTRVWRSPTQPRTTSSTVVQGCVGVVQEVVQPETPTLSASWTSNTTCTTKTPKKKIINFSSEPDVGEQGRKSTGEYIENGCVSCAPEAETQSQQGIHPCTTSAQQVVHSDEVVSESQDLTESKMEQWNKRIIGGEKLPTICEDWERLVQFNDWQIKKLGLTQEECTTELSKKYGVKSLGQLKKENVVQWIEYCAACLSARPSQSSA